jgi:hypothetical protein
MLAFVTNEMYLFVNLFSMHSVFKKAHSGEGRIKGNGGGMNSRMIYLIYCKNFCKMPQCTHTQHNNKNSNLKSHTVTTHYYET